MFTGICCCCCCLVLTHTKSYSTWDSLQTETFNSTKKSLLFKSFTIGSVITIADIWDATKKDFISNDVLLAIINNSADVYVLLLNT